MKKKKFNYIRTNLERLAKEKGEDAKIEINALKRIPTNERIIDNIIQRHREWLTGVNLAYHSFCFQFNIPYEPIKSEFSNY